MIKNLSEIKHQWIVMLSNRCITKFHTALKLQLLVHGMWKHFYMTFNNSAVSLQGPAANTKQHFMQHEVHCPVWHVLSNGDGETMRAWLIYVYLRSKSVFWCIYIWPLSLVCKLSYCCLGFETSYMTYNYTTYYTSDIIKYSSTTQMILGTFNIYLFRSAMLCSIWPLTGIYKFPSTPNPDVQSRHHVWALGCWDPPWSHLGPSWTDEPVTNPTNHCSL